jgi:hypothetical protein
MKIEIDLNNILGDEFGAETIQESVRRQVVEAVKRDIQNGIKNKVNEEVNTLIQAEVTEQVKAISPGLLNGLIDLEYQPLTSYGSASGERTTMRKQFIKNLQEQFQYKKTNYRSERNAFTSAIDDTIDTLINQFKTEYNKKIDEAFLIDAYNYALSKLKERLKI